jgi:DNA polymerase-3 subunit alpha
MEELTGYLKENNIDFKEFSNEEILINDEVYFLVKPVDGLLFDDKFSLIGVNGEDVDHYIFKFGGRWYHTPKDSKDKPKLNPVKYIGKVKNELGGFSFLGVHGGYELMNGSREYDEWCKKAKFMDVLVLGICEKNTLAGTLPFQLSCVKNEIRPIIGATYTVDRNDFRYDIKVYVKDEKGWENILLINKEVKIENNGYIKEKDFFKLSEGLVIVVDPKSMNYDDVFPLDLGMDVYYQIDTCEYVNNDRDKEYLLNMKKFIESNMKPVLISDAYYLDKEDSSIKKKLNLMDARNEYESNNQHFKSMDDLFFEWVKLFKNSDNRCETIFSDAMDNLEKVVEECQFKIETGKKHLPKYRMTPEEKLLFKDNEQLFWRLIEDGLHKKAPGNKMDEYIDRVEKEFIVIKKGNVIDYFLILWDIVKWSKDNDIAVGIGRGSAGGSLIAYLLGITEIDPIKFNLLFERFLNEGRVGKSLPDIDVDFEGLRRNEVKAYMEQRYGVNQVCSVGTYGTFQIKAFLKDYARMINFSYDETNHVTKELKLEKGKIEELFQHASKNSRIKSFVQKNIEMINDLKLVHGQPKNESIHACATLIVPREKDIFRWLPVKWGERDGEKMLVSEWEGGQLSDAGFLKEDILGILELDKFASIVKSIKRVEDKFIDLYKFEYEDDDVFEYFRKGWNKDTFQFGTKGLIEYCKQLQPEDIEDLIAINALYRPGAMESNFHNEYVLRKHGQREVDYMWGCEEITKDTYGLVIYQEQIMQICQKLGGFNLVEADDIRKIISSSRSSKEKLGYYKGKFLDNAIKIGCPKKEAEDIWVKLGRFASYGFNRSHAAAYTLMGYISQWFKVHYPVHFWETAFSFAKDKDISGYISEIYKIGDINVVPPDINVSEINFVADHEKGNITWGLLSIKQFGDVIVEELMKYRSEGKYFSFEEFLSRHNFKGSKVDKSVIENLVISGVFDDLEGIKNPKDRMKLIDFYRKERKVKIDKDKDLFSTNKKFLSENWWWILQQKLISGFAIFPYQTLTEEFLDCDYDYVDPDSFIFEIWNAPNNLAKIGGYVEEVIIRESKNGYYANITLECNYEFIIVVIWAEQWEVLSEYLEECEKKIILFSGEINHDSYKHKNVLTLNNDSEIRILE